MNGKHLLVAIALCASTVAGAQSVSSGFVPKDGFVPNKETAIRIAVAVWEPIYGRASIAAQAPYYATLKEGVWSVSGSLPAGAVGGTAFAAISQQDGTIVNVFHSK